MPAVILKLIYSGGHAALCCGILSQFLSKMELIEAMEEDDAA